MSYHQQFQLQLEKQFSPAQPAVNVDHRDAVRYGEQLQAAHMGRWQKRVVSGLATWLKALPGRLLAAWRQRQAGRDLRVLGPHLLRDIGVGPSGAPYRVADHATGIQREAFVPTWPRDETWRHAA
ncbi:MAG: hypothetical protein QF578_22445 [Alphaproteobacteria bacterium]|nr:hypothetical protein [Alphaproteobacteria bacterium]MDP6567606.1 hypothetical protein [Alphaproteobacteria bacterium]MDP6816098.1 hypothetical protein [Alphaproteobacteria bacterium]